MAELDMRDSNASVPVLSGTEHADCPIPTSIINNDNNPHCSSVLFPSHGFSYSKVCGMIRAYQKGTPDVFRNHGGLRNPPTLDFNYVDGISLTYGEFPR